MLLTTTAEEVIAVVVTVIIIAATAVLKERLQARPVRTKSHNIYEGPQLRWHPLTNKIKIELSSTH